MSSIYRLLKASPIVDDYSALPPQELPEPSIPESSLLLPAAETLEKAGGKPQGLHLSDADLDLQPSPLNFFAALGLAITILGMILLVAPTSGKITRLIGFVQSLMGSMLVSLSLQ